MTCVMRPAGVFKRLHLTLNPQYRLRHMQNTVSCDYNAFFSFAPSCLVNSQAIPTPRPQFVMLTLLNVCSLQKQTEITPLTSPDIFSYLKNPHQSHRRHWTAVFTRWLVLPVMTKLILKSGRFKLYYTLYLRQTAYY